MREGGREGGREVPSLSVILMLVFGPSCTLVVMEGFLIASGYSSTLSRETLSSVMAIVTDWLVPAVDPALNWTS